MITVPPSFRAMPRWWRDGQDWLEALPDLVEQQCRAWQLVPDGETAHGSNALVLPVRRAGMPAVLRMTPPTDPIAEEIAALDFWAGRGTVLLLDSDVSTGSTLLERLDAGRSLMSIPISQASHELGRMMLRLAVPATSELPSTVTMITERLTSMRRDWQALREPFPLANVIMAEQCAEELVVLPDQHAANVDLHHDQVLAGIREPWLTVDPRLARGDRAFDLARSLWTRLDELEDDDAIHTQLTIIADAAEIDHDHARRTAIFRTVDYWLWRLGHGLSEDPVRCQRLLQALRAC